MRMCRLLGAVLFDGYERDYNDLRIKLTLSLMYGECMQGGDGNGIALMSKDNTTSVYKNAAQMSSEYKNVMNFMSARVLENTKYAQIHTRLATHGSSHRPENLHPFVYPHIVGSHNGVISSYKYLWGKHKADVGEAMGENDSEIIFAMLNAYAPTLDLTAVDTTLGDISGVMAIAAYSPTTPDRFLLVSRENPVCYYFDKDQGVMWYASVPDILVKAGVCLEKDAIRLHHEMMLIDYPSASYEKKPLTETVSTWKGYSRYQWNDSVWQDDDYMGYNYSSGVTGKTLVATKGTALKDLVDSEVVDIDLPDTEISEEENVVCRICEDSGVITESEYIMMFGSIDLSHREWKEDEYDELVTQCDFCQPYSKWVISNV